MIKFFKNFRKDEDGAVTVDWVVLTAAVIGLAAVAYQQIEGGATGLATDVNTALNAATISTGEQHRCRGWHYHSWHERQQQQLSSIAAKKQNRARSGAVFLFK